mmetsp:Transcript_85507/g.151297  ORF Transcript_85507/g.151297 Transcript_85507/m.151297 type:complete len:204 (-) Transcript_85507:3406-4017(-)
MIVWRRPSDPHHFHVDVHQPWHRWRRRLASSSLERRRHVTPLRPANLVLNTEAKEVLRGKVQVSNVDLSLHQLFVCHFIGDLDPLCEHCVRGSLHFDALQRCSLHPWLFPANLNSPWPLPGACHWNRLAGIVRWSHHTDARRSPSLRITNFVGWQDVGSVEDARNESLVKRDALVHVLDGDGLSRLPIPEFWPFDDELLHVVF